jgi:hypothetical protein
MKKHFPNILLSKYIRGNIAMQIYTYRLLYCCMNIFFILDNYKILRNKIYLSKIQYVSCCVRLSCLIFVMLFSVEHSKAYKSCNEVLSSYFYFNTTLLSSVSVWRRHFGNRYIWHGTVVCNRWYLTSWKLDRK